MRLAGHTLQGRGFYIEVEYTGRFLEKPTGSSPEHNPKPNQVEYSGRLLEDYWVEDDADEEYARHKRRRGRSSRQRR